MTTFKQIIGRGTRILEEYKKTWFTIMDFKGATSLFADPDFDGEPVEIYDPDPDDPPRPPGEDEEKSLRLSHHRPDLAAPNTTLATCP